MRNPKLNVLMLTLYPLIFWKTMATAALDLPQPNHRRRPKSCFIKQGYHKSERDDARRVAARTFLRRITLDGQRISPRHSPMQGSHLTPQHTSISESLKRISDGRLSPFSLPSLLQTRTAQFEDEQGLPSPLLRRDVSYSEATAGERRQLFQQQKWRHQQYQQLCATSSDPYLPPQNLKVLGGGLHDAHSNHRIVFMAKGNIPCALLSILPYQREARADITRDRLSQKARTRVTSVSLEIDLEGLELGTSGIEVSLDHLLAPVWFAPIDRTTSSELDLGVPTTCKTSLAVVDPATTTQSSPTYCYQALVPSVNPQTHGYGQAYPWQSFRDHHTCNHVLLHYHPLCLDNYEYFVGKNTTTVSPAGYRVSIIQYAKTSDTNREINDRFKEIFPHINLPLTKVRKIKKDMQKIGSECGLELLAVAYAFVYYEKLVLMGKVNKPNRKIVAGACLLLAAKFITDMKQQDVKPLIDKISDVFRLSAKELLLSEFPVLAALQFSLVTPQFQVIPLYDRLRESEQS